MEKMFCFQCEQTARGTGCQGAAGVCGKTAFTANVQDGVTAALIGLSLALDGQVPSAEARHLVLEGLFATITNVNFAPDVLQALTAKINAETERVGGWADQRFRPTGEVRPLHLWSVEADIRSLKSLILLGLKGMAAYAYHAAVLGYHDTQVEDFCFEALRALGNHHTAEELTAMAMKVGQVNFSCMDVLYRANSETYGVPVPTKVPLAVEPGPFIVVTGHDLKDLEMLLQQTAGKGINIYTHGEMLPAHAYPKLKAYPHLRGNFGTAWQNQQKEFADIPGSLLFTTNCLMPPRPSYADRVFTTSVVAFPNAVHIGEDKDFAPVIAKALELGGYAERQVRTGINGGTEVTTGFGHDTILSLADTVIGAVKSGAIKHFFLVGGCDGAKVGRNYYTDFVKATPADTVVLTLACGKYRFNDLDLGTIGGIPRLLDMGQCNDAFGAIKVALALSEAFACGVNELPLTLVLSWYEQKAVAILLTLLSLGVKNIYLGPTLPAFVSPNILQFLVDNFQVTPITTPDGDLRTILG